jgi:hypothetical protein
MKTDEVNKKTKKNPVGAMLMLGAVTLATTLIARADKKTIVDGAGKFKDGLDAVVARAKPVRFAPILRAVEPKPMAEAA